MSSVQTISAISASVDASNHSGLGWYQTGQDRLNPGAPHFRRRKYKNSGYTLSTILKEYIDNVAKIAKHIDVTASVSPSGMIECITISDDYEHGFVNIYEHGDKNPFNFDHMRPGQDDDDELSEFGIGMKAAAVAAGNLFMVYTKVSGACHWVVCNFEEMEREPDVNKSYNPKHKIIDVEEYRANHPSSNGSTIVLSELHPSLQEITSQSQIQEKFSETISDAYSNYIQNGLIIRVNGVAVKEERDWFSDETCKLFTITTKILILEKQGFPRVMIAIRTDKNTTYKKYDTIPTPKCDTKTKNQKRLKKYDKKDLDELLEQGYRFSHQMNPMSDMHAIEIKSTIVLYSDAFDGENPPEPPLNHVHVHKDGRKYGSHIFEHRNDGNCNYSCHKIDLKSKQIGKELGITYNKQLQMNLQNDLTRMIREIIDDNNLNLNSNTSTSKNQQLCQRYLDAMNVDIMTCSLRKLSTHHKERRELLLRQASIVQPAIVQKKEVHELVIQEAEAEAEVEAEAVIQEAEVVQLVVQEETKETEAHELVVQEAQEAQEAVVQEQEAQEAQEAVVQEQALPNIVPDSVREVGPSVHQRITRAKGESIIDHWHNSGEHQATFDKTLDDLIKSYQDRSAPDQIQDMLSELNPSLKCKILLALIKKRHPLPEDDMRKGIELFRTYQDAFRTNAMVSL